MSPRPGFILALLLLGAACHRQSNPSRPDAALGPDAQLAKDVGVLASRAEALLREQDERLWRHWTEGAPLDLSDTQETHAGLYTPEALAKIDGLKRRTKDDAALRTLDLLRAHFASELTANTLATARAQVASLETNLTFEVEDEVYRLRDLERLLARERNALKRQSMHQAAARAVGPLDAAVERLHAEWEPARWAALYKSQLDLAAHLRRTEPVRLAQEAEAFLSETDALFRRTLADLAARELRLPLENVRARDLPRMFPARGPDALFAERDIRDRADATLRGLGIDLEKVLKLNEGGNPRPLALAVAVPDDVRLHVGAGGGARTQRRFLHELGHALHAAHTRQPTFSAARLGSGSVSRAFSELFAELTDEPAWLAEAGGTDAEQVAQHVRASAAWDLYVLRRAAGRLLYAVAWWSGEADATTYRTIMSRALGVPFEDDDAAFWRIDVETTLQSAPLLEAAFLSHQLRAQLRSRFGETWWRKSEAGDWLKRLWAHGTALNADELAREAGEPGLSSAPLRSWLGSSLAERTN